MEPTPTMTDEDGTIIEFPDRRWEVDEKGNFIDYQDSHFNVANIENEKRYLLKVGRSEYIPAVKRNEKYLNLVSMEEIDYLPESETKYAVSDVHFIGKSYFNL